jgi:hypothetical protein
LGKMAARPADVRRRELLLGHGFLVRDTATPTLVLEQTSIAMSFRLASDSMMTISIREKTYL